jgi:hypothetical protein
MNYVVVLQVEEKFSLIQEFLIGKPYVKHLVTPFFAVNNTLDDTVVKFVYHSFITADYKIK